MSNIPTSVSNSFEFAVVVINQLSKLFETTIEPYKFEVCNNGLLKILNDKNDIVLSITSNEITIKDIIKNAHDEVLYTAIIENKKVVYATVINEYQKNSHDLSDQFIEGLLIPEIDMMKNIDNEITFKYFSTEDVWFQQMTIHDNVLPFETAQDLIKIKKIFIEELKNKWNL
ncbi:hypothetical protein [Yersinia phage fHe-Yen9-04]|uniref:Uncharacterized protein n=1 Tax=Yersinia phage fHe-Yen9-04 TaxID=2052742 RepID=A0A2C9CY21_9CAUD|nr:hypothetical protein FDJ41_gp427 [Yersinia phage fHe-Yen9-04]SOK58753.1 hypothetical protein [Yersinia phage fHe-Yen9-04]VUE36522.1 hypothetical protein [Yersinia phage fHe-Yen9-04]